MKKQQLIITVFLSIVLMSCITGKKSMAEVESERERLASEEARGAKLCIPADFAAAKSELDFAETELKEGNYIAAEEHLSNEKKLAANISKNADSCIPKDKDKDGILDTDDKCPDKKGLKEFEGCPDTDRDGISDNKDKCPEIAGIPELEGCPKIIKDADKDGITDDVDQCPDIAEDIDGFEDHDGCPDPDNDKDGLCDSWVTDEQKNTTHKEICTVKEKDKCPNDAGIKENFGCPVLDTDKDGVPDIIDKCPSQPEDKDDFEDADGCPDPDNDNDGFCEEWVTDEMISTIYKDICKDKIRDKCPTTAGVKEESGCPKKYKLIVVTEQKIELKQTVFFETGKAKIEKKSYEMLKEVADAVKSTPSIKKVVVEGHTDNVGGRENNIKLSQKRAESVKEFLVDEGVEGKKLQAIGYGPDKPISSNSTKKGQAKNRRVEFKIEQ